MWTDAEGIGLPYVESLSTPPSARPLAGGLLLWGMSSESGMVTNSHVIQPGSTTGSKVYAFSGGVSTSLGASQIPLIYNRIMINRTNTYVNFSINNTGPYQITTNLPTTNLGLAFNLGSGGVSDQNWSLVRKWVAPEPTLSGYRQVPHPVKYYGYGDSITHGVTGGGLSPTGSDEFMMQMRDKHDPSAVANHFMDGDGWTSTMGWNNIDANYNTSMQYYVVMFGNNDMRNNIDGNTTGANLAKIYNYTIANGTTPVILMHPLEDPITRGNCSLNITFAEAILNNASIPYVRMYDALDSIPNNSVMNGYSGTYIPDGVHPNLTGHSLMGEYLWNFYFASATPLAASFSQSPNPSSTGATVTFSDTSTGNPTTWNWTFGDLIAGNTSALQNPTHTYTSAGTYSVMLNITNASGYWSNTSATHTVTAPTGFNLQDIVMDPLYTLVVHFTDSTTGAAIPAVTVTLSDGQTQTTTNGTAIFSVPYSTVVVYASATGYVSTSHSYVMDSDRDEVIQMVPANPNPVQSTWYTPHQVRFAVVDNRDNKLVGVSVNASAIASTFPADSTADWLTSMYGINAAAANDMLNGTLIMEGTTEGDGATTFTMLSSIGYRIHVYNPANGVTHTTTVTPIDNIYTIRIAGNSVNNTFQEMGYNTSLYITEPNTSYVTMNLLYQDNASKTSLLEFFVLAKVNNTVINYQSFTGFGRNPVLANYTVKNTKPNVYAWYYNAVRQV